MFMEFRKQGLSLDELRKLDIVDYLYALGYQPAKPSRNGIDYYYCSPLRAECNPSFHVNRKKNQWYDHGLGKGGNLIDFGMHYFACTYKELRDKFDGIFPLKQCAELPFFPREGMDETAGKITITGEQPIWSYPLKNYLHERHIPLSVAEQFCCEVSYKIEDRSYYAIGFKNDSGGYELRNKIFKRSCSPKNITTIDNDAKTVQVFEGFFDFLTYKTIHRQEPEGKIDYVILNGASLFERARPFMEQHEAIRLWLDRDTTGLAYTKHALSLSERYKDESGLYAKHKDLNDWLTKKGRAPKKQLKHKFTW
jgi:DNA primase